MTGVQTCALPIYVFGGITSCDTVAHGIVDAVTSLEETDKPIVVRLDGNNAEAGRQILAEAALEGVTVVDTMDEAAQTVTAIAHTLSQQPTGTAEPAEFPEPAEIKEA